MATTPKPPKKRSTPELKLSFDLDDERVAEIQRCLKKGKLTITISSLEKLGADRATNGYLYD
jgi:hypothetical protein